MATKIGEIYVCDVCGNEVQIVGAGEGVLICCGQKMKRI